MAVSEHVFNTADRSQRFYPSTSVLCHELPLHFLQGCRTWHLLCEVIMDLGETRGFTEIRIHYRAFWVSHRAEIIATKDVLEEPAAFFTFQWRCWFDQLQIKFLPGFWQTPGETRSFKYSNILSYFWVLS
jgi:hypothetical protein